jgi:hypothetical protein
VGSGNLHNIAGAAAALVPRPSSSDADKSLHASGVKGSTLRVHTSTPWRPVVRHPCSRAISRAHEHHGPLAQLVRAHG